MLLNISAVSIELPRTSVNKVYCSFEDCEKKEGALCGSNRTQWK